MKPAFQPFRTSAAGRPVPAWRALASLAVAACVACASGQAAAATIRWRTQAVHIKVEGRDVKDVLRDFASGQNVPATVASNISGTVSGDFNMSPQRFLDSLASSFGFVWFYDGNVLSVTSANDMARQVVRLNVASASELARTLAQMKLDSPQFPIVYDEGNATALVSGPPQYVALVSEIARQLDDTSARRSGSAIRIYHLQHAWAADHRVTIDGTTLSLPGVAATLNSMYHDNSASPKDAVQSVSGASMRRMSPMADMGGGTTGGGGGAIGGVLPPLPANGVSGMQALLPRLGNDASAQQAQPADGGDPPPARRQAGDNGGAGSRDLPVIVADQRTNSVLVRDVPGRLAQYGPLIAQLDVKPQLVEIEAHIIQVDDEALKQLGIEWRAHNSHVDFQTGNGVTGKNGYSGSSPDTNLTASTSNGTTTISTTPLGGSLTAVLGDAGRFLLTRVNALQQDNLAKIDASPKVATLDNVEAMMDNETRFFVRVASYTAADLYSVQTGVSMRVLPLVVNSPGRPQIKLGVHISDGQITGQQVDNIPIITSTSIDTEAFLNEGDALLIAGYRVNSSSHLENGIPVLSKIPLIGGLFRYRDDQDSKMERLFLLTPRIVDLEALAGAPTGDAGPALPDRRPARGLPPVVLPPVPPLPADASHAGSRRVNG